MTMERSGIGSTTQPSGPVPLLYATRDYELSCDCCDSQEGRHYCLTFGCQVKNMDIVRCPSWHPKAQDTEMSGAQRRNSRSGAKRR